MLAATASPCRADRLSLTIQDGKISIDAEDVTLRQILSEWARVGKTRILNIEKVTSGPMTVRLDNVSEQTALEILLRALPGYMAAPRTTYVADSSLYDRILILATTTAVAAPRPQPGAFQGTQLRAAPPVPNPAMLPGIAPDPATDEPDAPVEAAVPGSPNFPAGSAGTPFAPVPPGAPVQPGAPVPPGTVAPASPAPNPWNVPTGAPRSIFEPSPPQPPPAQVPQEQPVPPRTLPPPDR
jgi:hypothetical protein